jgi:hypothetical protein
VDCSEESEQSGALMTLLNVLPYTQANFLVQAALQRIDAATTVTAAADTAAADSTEQQQQQQLAVAMVAAVAALAPQLLAKRAGVLWRAAQACVRLSLSGESQDQFLQAVATAATTAAATAAATAAGDDAAAVESNGRGSSNAAAAVLDASSDAFAAARVWVPAVLELTLPGTKPATAAAAGDAATADATAKNNKTAAVVEKVDKFREGKLYMDVTAGRLVENLLRFKRKLAAPVVKAVVTLPEQVCTVTISVAAVTASVAACSVITVVILLYCDYVSSF